MTYRFCPMCTAPLEEKILDNYPRLVCTAEDCDFVHWQNPTPVVAAVVEREGKVVLTRSPGWPPGFHALVAGFLERNETPEEGIMREVKEELGLDTVSLDLIGHYAFDLRNQIIFAYHVEAEGEIVVGDELEGIKIVAPEEIEPWPRGTGPAVSDWLQRRKGRPADQS